MKVRNLILASLATVAMSACSNENDFVDNGTQTPTGETSQMKFGIAFPSSGARATTEVGTENEYEFGKIAVVISVGGVKSVMTFDRSEFTQPAGSNNSILYLKNSISVQAGEGQLYAFVNPSDALVASLKTTSNLTTLTENAGYTAGSIDALIASGKIAASKNFLMSNAGGTVVTESFTSGEVADVTISVDRAAVKLEEGSPTGAFTVTQEEGELANLKITLQQYSYANLATSTPVLYQASYEPAYFQPFGAFGEVFWGTHYFGKNITGKIEEKGDVTYTMENLNTQSATAVMYKAVAKWEGTDAATFYVMPDGTVYKSFTELQAKVDVADLTESSTIAKFAEKGIKKYEDGICYYNVAVKTGNDTKIVRNNVYKLAVSGIAKLGTTTPAPDPDPTTINLTVEILPWTVNIQENITLQ